MTLPIQTAEFWDGTADQYMTSAEPFTGQFCEDAAELAEIEPGIDLLDVATGPGALALAAARRGARVTAIDFSPAMVERLSERMGDLPIVARRMDGQALDLPDASFDRACSVFGVPLFPDWRTGLREMARVLRPGGRAVVAVADNGHGFGPNQFLAQARQEVTGARAPVEIDAWGILADRDRFAEEMRAAGLRAIEIHERTHEFVIDLAVFTSDHPMILRNPVLAGLSADDLDRTIHLAIERAAALSQGGKVSLPGTGRIATGIKA
jgi:ubiquinone/menaquinone biosynthesis C-methylase UbiE